RKEAQGDQHVSEHSQDGCRPVNPREPEGNIYQHARQSIEGNVDGLAAELGADLRPNDFDFADGKGAERVIVFERGDDRGSNPAHRSDRIDTGEDAVLLFVAILENTFGELLVAVTIRGRLA